MGIVSKSMEAKTESKKKNGNFFITKLHSSLNGWAEARSAKGNLIDGLARGAFIIIIIEMKRANWSIKQ